MYTRRPGQNGGRKMRQQCKVWWRSFSVGVTLHLTQWWAYETVGTSSCFTELAESIWFGRGETSGLYQGSLAIICDFPSCTHSPLKLKTFANTTKAYSLKLKGKEVVVRANHGFFSHLALTQSRSMDLWHVFNYSLGSVAWALVSLDGQLAKTSKCMLLKALEKDC